jgi:hypothetical protein
MLLTTGQSLSQQSKAPKAIEQEWIQAKEGFGVQLLFSGKPQSFLEDWSKPTRGVQINTSESAERGKPYGIFIIFAGCGKDRNGLADVVADLTLVAPDGKVYAEEKAIEVWQKKEAPSGKQLQLGVGYLTVVIEPKDLSGNYEIRAKVYDRIKGVELDLKRKFSVSDKAPATQGRTYRPIPTGDTASGKAQDWLTHYYKNPQPDRLVEQVRKMSAAGALAKENAQPPLVAMLSRVMTQNPDRIAEWMVALADLPESDRDVLCRAIWFSNTEAGRKYLQANKQAKYLKKPAPDILVMEIDSASVLDMLWGYFFATGEEKPIRRIVSALNYAQYWGALERYKTSKKTDEDEKHAHYESICRAALWSLHSNSREHPRVRAFCERLFHGPDLTDLEHKYLRVVLLAGEEDSPPSERRK